jgi:hypothetical protein
MFAKYATTREIKAAAVELNKRLIYEARFFLSFIYG